MWNKRLSIVPGLLEEGKNFAGGPTAGPSIELKA
jgi:hypothetical protein